MNGFYVKLFCCLIFSQCHAIGLFTVESGVSVRMLRMCLVALRQLLRLVVWSTQSKHRPVGSVGSIPLTVKVSWSIILILFVGCQLCSWMFQLLLVLYLAREFELKGFKQLGQSWPHLCLSVRSDILQLVDCHLVHIGHVDLPSLFAQPTKWLVYLQFT